MAFVDRIEAQQKIKNDHRLELKLYIDECMYYMNCLRFEKSCYAAAEKCLPMFILLILAAPSHT